MKNLDTVESVLYVALNVGFAIVTTRMCQYGDAAGPMHQGEHLRRW